MPSKYKTSKEAIFDWFTDNPGEFWTWTETIKECTRQNPRFNLKRVRKIINELKDLGNIIRLNGRIYVPGKHNEQIKKEHDKNKTDNKEEEAEENDNKPVSGS